VIVGAGALGSNIINNLARAGVGWIRIIDRDFVELSNLPRQILYDEDDVALKLPKAVAAARKIARINSSITVEARVEDVASHNILDLLEGAELLLDGTDNMETRFLINEACVQQNIPWIYGGAVGSTGMTMNIRPNLGPCLRCFIPELPPPGSLATCEAEGVLNTLPILVAAYQSTEAIKILIGSETIRPDLLYLNIWESAWRPITIERAENCPVCVGRKFEMLQASQGAWATSLCGRNAVQITPGQPVSNSLADLAIRLGNAGQVRLNDYFLELRVDGYEIILFPTMRAIIKGTSDISVARSIYSKYIGN
jgi:adenylyltransferase/sulfurtransferase